MVLCSILYLAKTGQKHAHNRQKTKQKCGCSTKEIMKNRNDVDTARLQKCKNLIMDF